MDERNWWGRNWKWFVPVGCLSIVLLFVLVIGLLVTFVFGMLKHSGGYDGALQVARANPQVVAALGTPIEDGWMVSGNINESGPSGSADMAIPISGPRGSATVYVEATKSAGQWKFRTLVAEIDKTHERIDLLASPDASTGK
jgi:hypothetical protein